MGRLSLPPTYSSCDTSLALSFKFEFRLSLIFCGFLIHGFGFTRVPQTCAEPNLAQTEASWAPRAVLWLPSEAVLRPQNGCLVKQKNPTASYFPGKLEVIFLMPSKGITGSGEAVQGFPSPCNALKSIKMALSGVGANPSF